MLDHFSKHLHGKRAVVVMDGAGWHSDLKRYKNIEFIFQPPYSPELNPLEKLSQYIKRHTSI